MLRIPLHEEPGRLRTYITEFAGWETPPSPRRIARQGHDVACDRLVIGRITGRTFSPTLEKPVAMGYFLERPAVPGTKLVVGISSGDIPAVVVRIPFYSRRT